MPHLIHDANICKCGLVCILYNHNTDIILQLANLPSSAHEALTWAIP